MGTASEEKASNLAPRDEGNKQKCPDWYLKTVSDETGGVLRFNVWPLPFLVGRRSDANLRLRSSRVSASHAQLYVIDRCLILRDLGSTNGTFVNGEQARERELRPGDILHFADEQFFVESEIQDSGPQETLRVHATELGPMPELIRETRDLMTLLRTKAVTVEFQPIVRLADGAEIAYEALGRGCLQGAATSPGKLFATAEDLGLACELSTIFREHQLDAARHLPALPDGNPAAVFVNTHPDEMSRWEQVLDSLRRFREVEPDRPAVLEIHESAVTDIGVFRALREQLDELRVGQAFDDFGTGQARLEELCEVSPDYVKFDIVFARELHKTTAKRRDMIRSLVRMMDDMKILTIIEGVEDADEAAACLDIGFDLAQGYHFGRPRPLGTQS